MDPSISLSLLQWPTRLELLEASKKRSLFLSILALQVVDSDSPGVVG